MDAESPVQCAVYAPEPTKEDLCTPHDGNISAVQHWHAASGPAKEICYMLTLLHSARQCNEDYSVRKNEIIICLCTPSLIDLVTGRTVLNTLHKSVKSRPRSLWRVLMRA